MATAPKGSPPYLSYTTFRTFLDSLANIGVPNRIDRSLMLSMSGSNQVLLLSAVRYLGLASENGVSAPELEPLAKSEGAERRKLWRQILARAYPELINSEFNLEAATTEEVAEVFKNQGVTSADTIRKCVTFFSRAAKDAGVKFSPHVKPYRGVRPPTRPERRRQNNAYDLKPKSRPPTDGKNAKGSTYLELLLMKVPDFSPKWTAEETDNWLKAIAGLKQITSDVATTNGSAHDHDEDTEDSEP